MKKLLICSILFFQIIALGQNNKIDSLNSILKSTISDTNKINILLKLGKYHDFKNPDSALSIFKKAEILAYKKNWNKGIAKAKLSIGISLLNRGDYNESIKYLNDAESYFNRLTAKEALNGKAAVYGNLGLIYSRQNNYTQALNYLFKSLKIDEENSNYRGMAANYGNIATIYHDKEEYEKAINYLYQALAINKKIGRESGVAANFSNIAGVYESLKLYNKSLYFYLKSKEIYTKIDFSKGIAETSNNLGNLYQTTGKNYEALKSYSLGLEINKRFELKYGLAYSEGGLGSVFFNLHNFKESNVHLNNAINISKQISDIDGLNEWYRILSQVDSADGDYKKSNIDLKLHILYRDSLENEEDNKKQIRAEMQYEFDKKQLTDSIRISNERKLSAIKLSQIKAQRYGLFIGLSLVIIFALFMFNRFKITQKQKRIIELKEKETHIQKKEIEEKQKEILDSIKYAKRIQQAHLPTEKYIDRIIKRK